MAALRSCCSLVLLFVVWTTTTTTLPSGVQGQALMVDQVSTHYLQVSWHRAGDWIGVTDYTVTFIPEDANTCQEAMTCNTPICTFNTLLYCGVTGPCTSTNITVSGGSTAESLSLVTGPEPVTDFSHHITDGVEHVSWLNPSTSTSPCYVSTALRFSFNDKEEMILLEDGEEGVSKSLCVEGYGEVEVWTEGGDGRSHSSLGTIIYNTSVVDLLSLDSCQPVGCSAIGLQWLYNPVCTDVAYIELRLDDVRQNVSVGTTNHTVEDLTVDYEYFTCVSAMDQDGQALDSSCQDCKTAYEIIRNLVVTTSSSTSLIASWEPPLCQREENLTYHVRAGTQEARTQDTTQEITSLAEFVLYRVYVLVERGYFYNDEREVYVEEFTAAPTPRLRKPFLYADGSLYIDWYFRVYNSYGYEFYFRLRWGKSLQYNDTVKDQTDYTFRNYGSVDDVYQICIDAVPGGREDLTSDTDCYLLSDGYYGGVDEPLSGGAIAGIVIASLVVVGLVAGGILYYTKRSKKAKRSLQQQQQHF